MIGQHSIDTHAKVRARPGSSGIEEPLEHMRAGTPPPVERRPCATGAKACKERLHAFIGLPACGNALEAW